MRSRNYFVVNFLIVLLAAPWASSALAQQAKVNIGYGAISIDQLRYLNLLAFQIRTAALSLA